MSRMQFCAAASAAAIVAAAGAARAAEPPPAPSTALEELRAQVAAQQKQLEAQAAILARQQAELERLSASEALLDETRGRGLDAPAGAAPAAAPIATVAQPPGTVGEAPPERPPAAVAAVPEGYGVLTPRGHWVLEPSIDFTHGSSNRLVFRGVEIVTGIQIGVIEASDADRNAWSGALAVRTGLTSRLEVEARLPYVWRDDRVTTLAQRDETISRTYALQGQDLGDAEVAARYQVNRGLHGWPVFIAGLRVKADNGTSPFEVKRDQFGVASELATGSGFWGTEGSVNFLYPTDPVVVFGGVSYLWHLEKDVNRDVGDVHIGKVDPGDSISANIGFGFAVNPRFSFSFGYKHSYIYPTISYLNGTRQKSTYLQVGALTLGWSMALSDRITLNNAIEIGSTSDSPDVRIVLRLPIRF